MKKIVSFLFILTLSFSNICFSQSGWFWQNPLPQGNGLRSLYFIDNNTGFAAGIYGTIIKTTNQGLNWIVIYTGLSDSIYSIYFTNYNTGFFCTNKGKVYKSSNGGFNWVNKLGIGNWISTIQFINENTGFIGGWGVFKTTNSGDIWEQISMTANIMTLKFFNENTGYIMGHLGSIQKTTNGGINWFYQGFGLTNVNLRSCSFLNPDTGFAVGSRWDTNSTGLFIKTTNGGLNWSNYIIQNSYSFYSIFFKDYNTGYAAGYSDGVSKTTNSGLNWERISLGNNNYYSVFVTENNSVYVIGGDWGCSMFKSTNLGNGWSSMLGNEYIYNGPNIFFSSTLTGYATGLTGKILKTTNSGTNWIYKTIDSNLTLNKFYFVNDLTGYSIGQNVLSGIYKSTNGGNNWVFQSEQPGNSIQSSIEFINSETGWASGWFIYAPNYSTGFIIKTTNGGSNWFTQCAPFSSPPFFSVQACNSNIVYAGANTNIRNTIRKSTNGGYSWYSVDPSMTDHLNNLLFLDSLNGFAVGILGKIIRTTNGGINWIQLNTNTTKNLNAIYFVNMYTGYAVGDLGLLIKTTNFGESWYQLNSNTHNPLNSVFFTSPDSGYIGGWFGTILKTTNGGGLPISVKQIGNIIKSFSLSQNYPNPFNPVTKIKFSLPAPSKGGAIAVKLIIYDVLGREIETLVNSTKKPGSYEVTWDGSRYASGVYFYRLMTDDASTPLSITKKMVLIK